MAIEKTIYEKEFKPGITKKSSKNENIQKINWEDKEIRREIIFTFSQQTRKDLINRSSNLKKGELPSDMHYGIERETPYSFVIRSSLGPNSKYNHPYKTMIHLRKVIDDKKGERINLEKYLEEKGFIRIYKKSEK